MDFDVKQKVLVVIYTEYQKDLPRMKDINYKIMRLSSDEFKVALDKLDNEGLVNGLKFVRGGDDSIPAHVVLDYAKMSPYGIEYVENKLGIEKTLSDKEKVEKMISKSTEFGFEQLKDFGARVLADILKV